MGSRVATVVHQNLLQICVSEVDVARMKAARAPHVGDWLNASPTTAVGLRLSDEAIRVAVGYSLGSVTCQPHTCICGNKVEARGLHRLSCRKSTPRHSPLTAPRPNLKSGQKSADPCCQRTTWPDARRRKATRRRNTIPMGTGQATIAGRHSAEYLRTVTSTKHFSYTKRCSRQSSRKQNSEI